MCCEQETMMATRELEEARAMLSWASWNALHTQRPHALKRATETREAVSVCAKSSALLLAAVVPIPTLLLLLPHPAPLPLPAQQAHT